MTFKTVLDKVVVIFLLSVFFIGFALGIAFCDSAYSGETDSATVKITLTIPPKKEENTMINPKFKQGSIYKCDADGLVVVCTGDRDETVELFSGLVIYPGSQDVLNEGK